MLISCKKTKKKKQTGSPAKAAVLALAWRELIQLNIKFA